MKKGFTLIELLAVIIIISVVTILVFPNVIQIINDSKQNLYEVQVSDIILESKNWALEYSDKLDKYHLNNTYVSVSTLKKEGFLEMEDMDNPLTGEEMEGCVEIKYNADTSQHTYKYYDEKCSDIESVISDVHGKIYTYDSGSEEIIEKNVLEPAALKIYNYYEQNNLINTLGGTTDGLYDLGDTYVFRGSFPNNYIKIGSEYFRILSIDKDYRMRVMSTTPLTNNWSNDTTYTNFLNSNVSERLITYLETETNSINKFITKIVDGTTLYVGSIGNDQLNYDVLTSVEKSKSITNKIGLINISDYVIASLDNNCINNIYSGACGNNNYLADTFFDSNVWTINPSSEINTAKIIKNKNIENHSITGNETTFRTYPVITLNTNAYITSGTGSSSSPYILN